MPGLPRAPGFDDTLALLSDTYGYIGERCRQLGSDAFLTRLMLRPVVCMQGPDAAEVFYGDGRFCRAGAIPRTTLKLLQDKGSVQQMEGKPHHRRKAMFMGMMTPEAIADLTGRFAEAMTAAAADWQRSREVVLFDAIRLLLTRVACDWAAVPLRGDEVDRRSREFGAMIDRAGAVGPSVVPALMLRRRSERWAADIVRRARVGDPKPRPGSPLALVAAHEDEDGRLLDPEVAAIELLNVLRPTVAVDRFIVFAAHALHLRPDLRARLAAAEDPEVERFVQEVRRHYPFFPLVGGRATADFRWRDHEFKAGDWAILGLFATNHHPSTWRDPDRFDPDRFLSWSGSPYDFVPQGGGAFLTGHRCPGEWITIALMKQAVTLLAGGMTYIVPEQDLAIDRSKAPALPASRFVIREVRLDPRAASVARHGSPT